MVVLSPTCNPTRCGKDFRESLRRPSPIIGKTAAGDSTRIVPAFTIQALQKNTYVLPPPTCDIFKVRPCKPTKFRDAYLKQELPIFIEFVRCGGRQIGWKVPVEQLDLAHYLPIFMTGLCEGTNPFDFLVAEGLKDIFTKSGHRVLACLPIMVMPLKEAMQTKNPHVVVNTMRCLERMCKLCHKVGPALVPYYRFFLPIANLILVKGRQILPTREKCLTVVPSEDAIYMIESTLQVLEVYGGPDAFLNIKYHVPTYESYVSN